MLNAYVVHVLSKEVLQRLTDGVTFLNDPLPTLVTCARRVRHQRSAGDDAFQTFLQRGPRPHLVVRQWVHDHLLLEIKL